MFQAVCFGQVILDMIVTQLPMIQLDWTRLATSLLFLLGPSD